ncbi:hypothetical protein [Dactylosporangium sp. CA-139066]|uniref:hypothetical protein n=1 Tax=Dactylosporangium sp. CA-139066 TaxID=3239930 RepID=UPI003D8D98F9
MTVHSIKRSRTRWEASGRPATNTTGNFRYNRGAPGREALIEWACAPPPVRLPDITRDELVEIVRHILADPTDDWYIEAFERNTVMPGASGLIFHPPPEVRDATAEEIVDATLLPPNRPVMRYALEWALHSV